MESTEKKPWRFKTEEELRETTMEVLQDRHKFIHGLFVVDDSLYDNEEFSELFPEYCKAGTLVFGIPKDSDLITTDPLPAGYDFPHAKHEWRVANGYAKEVKKQWRFKTEEELIRDFADGWKTYWRDPKKDYLFGMPVSEEQVKRGRGYDLHPDACPHDDYFWYLDSEIITIDPLPSDYDFPYAKHEWRVKHGYAKEVKSSVARRISEFLSTLPLEKQGQIKHNDIDWNHIKESLDAEERELRWGMAHVKSAIRMGTYEPLETPPNSNSPTIGENPQVPPPVNTLPEDASVLKQKLPPPTQEEQEAARDGFVPLPLIEDAPQDPVNRPTHYTQGGIECIDAIEASMSEESFRGFLKGNILKYVWRYENKNGIQDLKKAQWYLNKLIGEIETE
jgi:hypothetical protein